MMCWTRYISICLREKYFAMRISNMSLIYSIGSIRNSPILYHRFMPLISGAKNKSPNRAIIPSAYARKIRKGSLFNSFQSMAEKNTMRRSPMTKNPACFSRLEKSPFRKEELYMESSPIQANARDAPINTRSRRFT